MNLEGFVPIPDLDYHLIHRDGRVWTVERIVQCGIGDGQRTIPGRLVKPEKRDNRLRVVLQEHGKIRKEFVHRLLLLTFKGPPPENKLFALHKNDNPLDNDLDNLYWGDQIDNMADRKKNKGYNVPKGSDVKTSVYSEKQIENIYLMLLAGTKPKEIIRKFGGSPQLLSNIKSKRQWKYVTNDVDNMLRII